MYYNPGHSQGILNYITSMPDGTIVLIAVYDSANNCDDSCQEALRLVGGTGQLPAKRGMHDSSINVKLERVLGFLSVVDPGFPRWGRRPIIWPFFPKTTKSSNPI